MKRVDRAVVITGASKGIGRELAQLFAERARWVVGIGRSSAELEKALAFRGSEEKAQGIAIVADVTKREAVKKAFEQIANEIGKIDLLINNAGRGEVMKFEETEVEDWDMMLDVNLKGAFLCTKNALPLLKMSDAAMVLNIASVCGLRGVQGYTTYCASKFGLIGLTEALAKEYRSDEIAFSAVCPAAVNTGFANEHNRRTIPPEYMLRPEEVAQKVVKIYEKWGKHSALYLLTLNKLFFLCNRLGIPKRPIWLKRLRIL
jgi:3-oxoacyl-[acyl-carrier protein] reductase